MLIKANILFFKFMNVSLMLEFIIIIKEYEFLSFNIC